MKIATLTFHRAINYGASLQTFALYDYLRKNCKDDSVGVLDYLSPLFKKRYSRKIDFRNPKKAVYLILTHRSGKKKELKFRRFLEDNINLIPFDEAGTVDKCFVGSDQVWNGEIVGYDNNFLLDFLSDEKKLSYAASIGVTELSDKEKQWLKRTESFYDISVRESSAAELIKSVTGRECTVVPDPVFLLSKNEWQKVEKPVDNLKEPFVLIYKFNKDNRLIDKAVAYAKERGLRVAILTNSVKKHKGCIGLNSISPDEFLWLVHHSECVFTNSFHATAFSVLYNKPFYSDMNTERNTRMKELLSLLDLQDREIIRYDAALSASQINWEAVNSKLREYCQTGKDFIASSLK